MADYKRMVSYMYQYDKGVKGKNVGFARIEARNGQCKVTLHMQLLGQSDSIFPTYLILRDEKNMDLIYLGDAVLKSQIMDSKFITEEKNIMDSDHSLTEMGGMLIFLNQDIFFATEWDDKPIVAKDVEEALKPKKLIKPSELGQESPIDSAKADDHKTDDIQDVKPSAKLRKNGIAAASEPVLEVEEELELISVEEQYTLPKYKLPRGFKTIERLRVPVSTVDPDKVKQAAHAKLNQQTEAKALAEEEKEASEHPVAQNFFEHYPRIYPFEDNEVILCVKIQPKDIGMLPKELWGLSNNSFLMHGFYCYHHLIFAKLKDRYGCRYILGIPGIYHNRERFMANMFGFEEFKSIRRRELMQGDFGYWFLTVTLY